MKDEDKSKEQLLDELVKLRQQVGEPEKSEVERKWAERSPLNSRNRPRRL
jgi:hypothetical protein